jgi:hypothetical protein
MAEEIRFPIVGEDRGATRVLRDVGRESAVTAAQTRLLAESLDKEQRAANSVTDALLKVEKASTLVAITERALDAEARKADLAMRGEADAAQKLGRQSADAAGKSGLGSLIGAGGMGGGGMAALVAAGVALAPVLVTVGVGLGGLALAALSAGKRSKELQQQLTPLKNDFKAFGDAVEPALVMDFAAAAKLAGQVLRDIRPVTVATGQAMAGFLGQLGKNFQGQEWQQFFQFMARTAGPDIRMLGTTFIDLTNTLPPLLKALQPVAVDLISIADASTKVIHATANVAAGADKQAQHENVLAKTTDLLRTVLFAPGVGLYEALKMVGLIAGTTGDTAQRKTAPGLRDMADNARVASVWVHTLATQVQTLNTEMAKSISPNATFNTDLINMRNAAAQASAAMHKTHDEIGLNTQAKRNAASADQGYIDALVKLTQDAGTNRQKQQEATQAIRDALPMLKSAKGGTREYWQEVRTLINYLDTLRKERTIREAVVVTGTGRWSAYMQSGAGHAVSPGGAASGAFIRAGTTSTADDVLARVSKGELIVPARMVSLGLVDHLRGAIPGFAAGGIVPSYQGDVAGLPPWASHNQQATVSGIVAGIARAFASAFQSMFAGVPGGRSHAAMPWLEGLWTAAGGPPGLAHLMAAIAMAESGGNPAAYNPSGATGLWQILGAVNPADQPFLRNPAVNAHEAVLKWRTQGLGAWVTYTDGAYRQYYDHGGWLMPGTTVAVNNTGAPERVGAGNTYNINVHVPPSANQADVGRQIVQAIRMFEQRSGTGWRR